jgi:uncharacterized membrane protein (DUF106 family)
MSGLDWFLIPPGSAISLMFISLVLSIISSSLNRLLITKMVGWKEYRIMQKEIAEYRSQTTKALRSKDTKLHEKLKRKEPQITNMTKKMAKPQLALMAVSFSFIFVWWFFLIPTYQSNIVAYIPVPGLGPVSVFWWYFLCSMFFGTLISRIWGIQPIE